MPPPMPAGGAPAGDAAPIGDAGLGGTV
jgi:hypothetical protein